MDFENDIHSSYASILETAVKTKNKKAFPRSRFVAFIPGQELNNERPPFPRVYKNDVQTLESAQYGLQISFKH